MKSYISIKNKYKNEISILENKLYNRLSDDKNGMFEYYEKFLFSNPKRLRPVFIFLICNLLCQTIDDEVINLALAIEIIHSASLIHDDIIDEAQIRRNLPCLHIEKGTKLAVLAGDYLLTEALEVTDNSDVHKIIIKAASKMAKSEIESLLKRFGDIEEEEYIKFTKNKTAPLFKAGIEGLFKIKNIKEDDLIKFSENFAYYFQLKDDINNSLNKDKYKTSNDEKEGILTLRYIMKKKYKDCDTIQKSNEFLNNVYREGVKLLDKYAECAAKTDLINLYGAI